MAQRSLAETVSRLLKLSKPTFTNGRWRKPAISRQELAMMRKYLVAQGADWPAKKLRDRGNDKPYKLSEWERGKDARRAKIAENMAKMPDMIADHRKKVQELRESSRKKKQRSEEEEYLIATGKKQQEGPAWQIFKDASKTKHSR